jgi:flagellar hook-associated protein 2
MSLSTGLISGMDTGALISQLIQAEASPQTALKSRMSATQSAASAYRTVNVTFLAITAAAEAALKPEIWTSTKATSNSSTVAVAVGSTPVEGSLTFTVESVAANHGVVNRNAAWTSATSGYGASSIEVFDSAGASKGTIAIKGTQTLKDAADAINADTAKGLSAAVVQVRGGATPEFALQISARDSGADSTFTLTGTGTFGVTSAGTDAQLKIGDGVSAGGYSVYSRTNVFDAVMPGATITVSKKESTPVTATVVSDPDAVASKFSSLVDAVNSALSTVKTYTNNSAGSTAALKGDFPLTSLSGRLLDAVSGAVGLDGSPAKVGFQLTKDGKITFDKAKFVSALKENPALAQRMVSGRAASDGPDGVPGGADDVVAVTGIATKLLAISKSASDATTGSIVSLANGQDSLVKDMKARIDAWDLRLAKRKETLTRQFTAMETALSSLRNQSTWLAGQINSLPSY